MPGASKPTHPLIRPGVSLAELTTLRVGGESLWNTRVSSQADLEQALSWASHKGLPFFYLGEGSNVLPSDHGFPGLVIQSGLRGRERYGTEVEVGGSENLTELILWLNGLGLGGTECLYGIPGSIAGAVVGNAGAYGQQIGDLVKSVTVFSSRGARTLENRDLEFDYRHSVFKRNREWFIASCRLQLAKVSARTLQQKSQEVLSNRLTKYPAGLRCPGSFFKNVSVSQLSEPVLARIPEEFIMFGKIPAGKLLEAVGANGARRGDAQFANYHGNLILNLGRASSSDILSLAEEYSQRVWEKFGIRLEPEVLILDKEYGRLQDDEFPE